MAELERIFQLNAEREQIVAEVVRGVIGAGGRSASSVELLLNDAAFCEIARLSDSTSGELAFWKSLYRRLGSMDQVAKESELRRLVLRCVEDVVGNFDPKVYRLATRVVPVGLSLLLRPQLNWDRVINLSTVRERIHVQGELDLVRALAKNGTLILAPTHLSNLDSLVIGWSLYANGLPPFTYGAGKNLFFNWIISYFMHNLGAYKVDRRLKYRLYKEVLKTYSQVLLERGFHSLFFPGGTRSRSGEVERKLKLGLLSTGLAATIANLQQGKPKPQVFVVPCTINYHLVLEAETLIADHLKAEGQHRYIIENDESSRLGRIWDYARKTTALDATLVVQYGAPMDLWGNRVDAAGVSYDLRGRRVDTSRYLVDGNEIVADSQRDMEYVAELGQCLTKAFAANTVVLPTHLVAYALFNYLRRQQPGVDLFRFLRLPPPEALPEAVVLREVDRVYREVVKRSQQGRLLLGGQVKMGTVEGILAAALRYFQMYHSRPVLLREDSGIVVNDLKLLLYYHNRLAGYGLEAAAGGEAH